MHFHAQNHTPQKTVKAKADFVQKPPSKKWKNKISYTGKSTPCILTMQKSPFIQKNHGGLRFTSKNYENHGLPPLPKTAKTWKTTFFQEVKGVYKRAPENHLNWKNWKYRRGFKFQSVSKTENDTQKTQQAKALANQKHFGRLGVRQKRVKKTFQKTTRLKKRISVCIWKCKKERKNFKKSKNDFLKGKGRSPCKNKTPKMEFHEIPPRVAICEPPKITKNVFFKKHAPQNFRSKGDFRPKIPPKHRKSPTVNTLLRVFSQKIPFPSRVIPPKRPNKERRFHPKIVKNPFWAKIAQKRVKNGLCPLPKTQKIRSAD